MKIKFMSRLGQVHTVIRLLVNWKKQNALISWIIIGLLFHKTEAYQHLERSSLPLLHKRLLQQLDPPCRNFLSLNTETATTVSKSISVLSKIWPHIRSEMLRVQNYRVNDTTRAQIRHGLVELPVTFGTSISIRFRIRFTYECRSTKWPPVIRDESWHNSKHGVSHGEEGVIWTYFCHFFL